jgi:protein ERP2
MSVLKFYFAVQSGGSFDIDFDVRDPHNKILLSGEKERQGDYVLTANSLGEYGFCFENDMSTLTDKLVDFDIMVESEPRREAPVKAGQISEHTSALEESIFRLSGMLMNIKRLQKKSVALWSLESSDIHMSTSAFILRRIAASPSSSPHRGWLFSFPHHSILDLAYSRLFWYAVFETLCVIGMAVYVSLLRLQFIVDLGVQSPSLHTPNFLHQDWKEVQGVAVDRLVPYLIVQNVNDLHYHGIYSTLYTRAKKKIKCPEFKRVASQWSRDFL